MSETLMPLIETIVLDSWQETPTVHAIRLEKPAGFSFKPGQYALVEIAVGGGREDHTFSFACSPARNYLEFATRLSDSEYKKSFAQLKNGDKVTLMGPTGRFTLDESVEYSVLLSGGIGITPFRSMLEWAVDTRFGNKVTLFYGNRSDSDIPFQKELDSLSQGNPNVSVVHSVSEASPSWKGRVGRIDAGLLQEKLGDLNASALKYYVCGPPGMVSGLQAVLAQANVPAERIAVENFSGYQ